MSKVFSILYTFCFLCIGIALNGQSIYNEIENIILHDTDISYELTPGFIIGVVDGDSTYIESYGGRADERKRKLDSDDLFEIGSVTKLFTASLIDLAIAEGVIAADAKLNDFLTIEYQNPRMQELSISELVNHQSGLPKRPFGFGEKEVDPQNPYEFYTKMDLLTSYAKYVKEENSFTYSHMNYGLLEIVLEQAYNLPYPKILNEKLLIPLGMNQTFINFKEDKDVLTAGLDRSGTKVEPWLFSSFAASEGVKTSLNDMLKFMRANLGIDGSNFASLCEDNFNDRHASFNENIVVSNGWQILKINKKINAAMHTGSTSGYSAFIGLVNETGTGVVVLSNSTFGTKDLGFLVLRMVNHNWKRKPN